MAIVTNRSPAGPTEADFDPASLDAASFDPGGLLLQTYDELRRLAGTYLRGERTGHTLQPTALVHEAWVRLADHARHDGTSRERFIAEAATVMRHILVDHARARNAAKRGGGGGRVAMYDVALMVSTPTGADALDILALDEALERLRAIDPAQARLVELRFFGGLTLGEAAAVMSLSQRTADREWRCAKAWLADAIRGACHIDNGTPA
ncbi:MAG: ECF-type sigma factor [Phycisphaerae bacterium]|nr:ECF-type sigma factor [Phycisphaerae bacterium]